MEEEMRRIVEAVSVLRTAPWQSEAQLHEQIARALEVFGLSAQHEAKLGGGRRIDFLCGTVGIEVKCGKPERAAAAAPACPLRAERGNQRDCADRAAKRYDAARGRRKAPLRGQPEQTVGDQPSMNERNEIPAYLQRTGRRGALLRYAQLQPPQPLLDDQGRTLRDRDGQAPVSGLRRAWTRRGALHGAPAHRGRPELADAALSLRVSERDEKRWEEALTQAPGIRRAASSCPADAPERNAPGGIL